MLVELFLVNHEIVIVFSMADYFVNHVAVADIRTDCSAFRTLKAESNALEKAVKLVLAVVVPSKFPF